MYSVRVHATRRSKATSNRCYVEFLASGTYAWESLWERMFLCGSISWLLFGWYKEFDDRLEGIKTHEWVRRIWEMHSSSALESLKICVHFFYFYFFCFTISLLLTTKILLKQSYRQFLDCLTEFMIKSIMKFEIQPSNDCFSGWHWSELKY